LIGLKKNNRTGGKIVTPERKFEIRVVLLTGFTIGVYIGFWIARTIL